MGGARYQKALTKALRARAVRPEKVRRALTAFFAAMKACRMIVHKAKTANLNDAPSIYRALYARHHQRKQQAMLVLIQARAILAFAAIDAEDKRYREEIANISVEITKCKAMAESVKLEAEALIGSGWSDC